MVVRQHPYQVPEACSQAIEEEINQLLKDEIIDESATPWSSPTVMVLKPDRIYNSVMPSGGSTIYWNFIIYLHHHVNNLEVWLGKSLFILTLELNKGYWQVALATEAKTKTTFSTFRSIWQYQFLPFCPPRAPATFQRLVDIVLRSYKRYAPTYIYKVIIHPTTWLDHLYHLGEVRLAA